MAERRLKRIFLMLAAVSTVAFWMWTLHVVTYPAVADVLPSIWIAALFLSAVVFVGVAGVDILKRNPNWLTRILLLLTVIVVTIGGSVAIAVGGFLQAIEPRVIYFPLWWNPKAILNRCEVNNDNDALIRFYRRLINWKLCRPCNAETGGRTSFHCPDIRRHAAVCLSVRCSECCQVRQHSGQSN